MEYWEVGCKRETFGGGLTERYTAGLKLCTPGLIARVKENIKGKKTCRLILELNKH